MERKTLVFIYNPNAGKGKIRTRLSQLIDIFTDAGYEVIAAPTKKRLDARDMAEAYAGEGRCERIVCSGGDGTLNEVVTGVLRSGKRVPIGYVPAGTTNDFAYSLQIPREVKKAAMQAAGGALFSGDVGSLNGSYFTYTAAFGIFTDVSYDTPQNFKNAFGRAAYILSGISRLSAVKPLHMQITYDGEEMEGDFLIGMITNSNSVGGFHGLTGKEVALDDGSFELLLIKMPQNLLELQAVITQLTAGVRESSYIYTATVREAVFTADEPVPWAVDGEYGGAFERAELIVHPRAVDYVIKGKREN